MNYPFKSACFVSSTKLSLQTIVSSSYWHFSSVVAKKSHSDDIYTPTTSEILGQILNWSSRTPMFETYQSLNRSSLNLYRALLFVRLGVFAGENRPLPYVYFPSFPLHSIQATTNFPAEMVCRLSRRENSCTIIWQANGFHNKSI